MPSAMTSTGSREIQTCKVKGYDGYMYEPCWLHPQDAAERGIKHGDIVKVLTRGALSLAEPM